MKEKIFHVLPHFHYDVIYTNTYQGYMKITLGIIKKALEMMEKIKGYTFGVEQTIILEEFVKRNPQMKRKLARFLKSGQMEITCGMFCMPDMNIPSGESLLRQIKRGKEWLKAEFGIEPRVCLITDCFGHHRQIPQILKKCGYDYYSFSRGMVALGPTEFWWKGVDGTKILTHWNYLGYGSGESYMRSCAKNWDGLRESAQDIGSLCTTENVLIMLGGDFCYPIPHSSDIIKKLSPKKNQASFSTLTKYMNRVKEISPNLRTIDKEFNPMMEGCYSTRIYIKQNNRILENQILTLEKICALIGKEEGSKILPDIWDDILINQFHDTICGSIIDDANSWAEEIHKKVVINLSRTIPEKMKQLAGKFIEKGQEPMVAVFNPLPSRIRQVINFKCTRHMSFKSLTDDCKNHFPMQKTDEGYMFVDTLPPIGIKYYGFSRKRIAGSGLKISEDVMENKFYKLKISRGVISSLVDKASGEEFVDKNRPVFNTLAIQIDEGDPWILYRFPLMAENWQPKILPDPMPERLPFKERYLLKTKHEILCERTDYQRNKIEIIENGPVRTGLKIKGTLLLGTTLKVRYEQCIFLYNDIRRIDFTTRIIPSGKRYRIRVCFPTPFKKPEIIHEIPLGAEKRPEGEFPALNWVNYVEGGKGLLVLNKGLPGNNFQDGVAMLSLFRSVTMELWGKTQGCYSEGREHIFEYAIIPYTRRNPVSPALEGQSYNTRCPVIFTRVKKDTLICRSFLEIEPNNVILSSLFHEKDGCVIRIYESEGKYTSGLLKMLLPVENIYETDCLGGGQKELPIRNNKLAFSLKPFEIKTYLLRSNSYDF